MTYSDTMTVSHLPDPVTQPGFYQDTPVKRGLAWVIDLVFVSILVVPAVVMTAFTALFFLPLLFLIVGFAYRVFTIASGSATWGMRLMSIELRNANGQRLDFTEAFLHTLGYSISVAFAPLQLISIVLMFTSERRQGLSDMVLGTAMLNRRA